jgi:hypothetical protein
MVRLETRLEWILAKVRVVTAMKKKKNSDVASSLRSAGAVSGS